MKAIITITTLMTLLLSCGKETQEAVQIPVIQASLLGTIPPGHREYLASLKPAPPDSRIVLDPRGCEYVLLYQPGSNNIVGFVHMPTCRNWKKHNPDYDGHNGILGIGSGTP